ncbi:TPA: two-component system response regulator [bacterium]|nr:two-component system response regulator [bacterium]
MPKILVIDDDVDMVDLLKIFLEEEGYTVITSLSGKKGIDYAHKYQPDFILLDIMMPEIDGWEVCRRLKACSKTKDIPIAIITARIRSEENKIVETKSIVDYITKPFNPIDLKMRIDKIIGKNPSSNCVNMTRTQNKDDRDILCLEI